MFLYYANSQDRVHLNFGKQTWTFALPYTHAYEWKWMDCEVNGKFLVGVAAGRHGSETQMSWDSG